MSDPYVRAIRTIRLNPSLASQAPNVSMIMVIGARVIADTVIA